MRRVVPLSGVEQWVAVAPRPSQWPSARGDRPTMRVMARRNIGILARPTPDETRLRRPKVSKRPAALAEVTGNARQLSVGHTSSDPGGPSPTSPRRHLMPRGSARSVNPPPALRLSPQPGDHSRPGTQHHRPGARPVRACPLAFAPCSRLPGAGSVPKAAA